MTEPLAPEVQLQAENADLRRRVVELELANARLRELADQGSLLAALQRVNNAANSSLRLDAMLSLVLDAVAEVMRVDVCSIYLLDGPDRLVLRATRGLNPQAVGRVMVYLGEGITGWAAKEGRPVAVTDAWSDPRFRYVAGLGEERCRSMLSVPIIVFTVERLLGVLNIQMIEQREFSAEEISFVQTVAGQIAIAIENAMLYEQTDQKLREKVEEAQRNLAAKTALVSEMHHRVKNNLQTVASLLSLQARRAKSPELVAPLWESVARVQSIAAVHDLLSRKELGVASIDDIAKQLIEVATVNPIRPEVRVAFKVEGGDLRLGSKEATVLALVLNELIANAIRHGFAGRQMGTIAVRAKTDSRAVVVAVEDDGCGVGPDFDPERDGSLGLQIVQTLVRTDLQGELQMEPAEPGTRWIVRFSPARFVDSPAVPR